MIKINNKFDVEQTVYLKSDPEQYKRFVTSIIYSVGGNITYILQCSSDEPTEHYDFEISTEKEIQL